MKPISLCIAEKLGVKEQQVAAAILLDGGLIVPFASDGSMLCSGHYGSQCAHVLITHSHVWLRDGH